MLSNYPELIESSQTAVNMAKRQDPLRESYVDEPYAAWVVDSARTSSTNVDASYPLGSAVRICDNSPVTMPVGVHWAVGGDSNYPTPGDILCGAIASCLDSTIRIIANRLSVELSALDVEVLGGVDVRGTLLVDKDVPVGFRRFDITVRMRSEDSAHQAMFDSILTAAENSCVVLQTMRGGPDVTITRK